MMLASEGLYTSTYDEHTKEVTMCVLSEEFSMFADQPKSAFYAIINIETGVVTAEEEDKRAIVDHLIKLPRAAQNRCMSDDAFLASYAKIDYDKANKEAKRND